MQSLCKPRSNLVLMSTAAAVGQSKHLVQRLLPFKTKGSDVSRVTEGRAGCSTPTSLTVYFHWGKVKREPCLLCLDLTKGYVQLEANANLCDVVTV